MIVLLGYEIRTKTDTERFFKFGIPSDFRTFHEVRFSNPVRNTCKIRSALVIARSSSGELSCSTCISVNRRSIAAFAASRELGNFLSSVSKRAASYSPVQTYCFKVAPLFMAPLRTNATPSNGMSFRSYRIISLSILRGDNGKPSQRASRTPC
jgi:hypothetical protein